MAQPRVSRGARSQTLRMLMAVGLVSLVCIFRQMLTVSEDGAMAEGRAAPIVLQLVRALRHCHQRKIAHRDVKLDNVIYDADSGRAVLCDFGLALAVRSQGSRLDVRCGSPEYNAPEILDGSKGYCAPRL